MRHEYHSSIKSSSQRSHREEPDCWFCLRVGQCTRRRHPWFNEPPCTNNRQSIGLVLDRNTHLSIAQSIHHSFKLVTFKNNFCRLGSISLCSFIGVRNRRRTF